MDRLIDAVAAPFDSEKTASSSTLWNDGIHFDMPEFLVALPQKKTDLQKIESIQQVLHLAAFTLPNATF